MTVIRVLGVGLVLVGAGAYFGADPGLVKLLSCDDGYRGIWYFNQPS